ncbi:MAG: cytochrome c [Bacteroidales bacterium]|nr:cytochrome c [Bacteroidales bacterium]
MKISKIIIFSMLAVLIASCNNTGNSNKDKTEEEKKETAVAESLQQSASTDEPDFMEAGKKVYNRVCLVCHQEDGSGVPNMYPPVIESDYISGNTDSLIYIILEGMKGPVVVKGVEYNSIMPPQKGVLDDHEVADLLNYLRNSFGNSGEFVKPEDVAEMR